MVKKLVVVVVFFAALCFAGAGCYRGGVGDSTYHDGPDRSNISYRIKNQESRVNAGIASGELTRSEAGMLHDNLNWIRDEFARMKADGRLNPNEMKRLDHMLDQNSAMIQNKKHNPIRRVY